jgi:hypothetical protein
MTTMDATFDVRTTDLNAINSLTKYPSIPTYHVLDPSNGDLLDEVTAFAGPVIGTEKVDGTNGRIIFLPDRTYLIGSREELLYARGDLIGNPALGIVDALRPIADRARVDSAAIVVLYLEVYGGKIGAASKRYTDSRNVGWRLFDVCVLDDHAEMLDWPPERISAWREAGGQLFLAEEDLQSTAAREGLELTPRLFTLAGEGLPTDLETTRAFLAEHCELTRVALDDTQPGQAEGVVLRTPDRAVIAKARFQDYDRTLRRRAGGRRSGRSR